MPSDRILVCWPSLSLGGADIIFIFPHDLEAIALGKGRILSPKGDNISMVKSMPVSLHQFFKYLFYPIINYYYVV